MDSFGKNVFINCPFDDEYLPMLRPLLFTILYVGLNPRIASERMDLGEARVNKIIQIISESNFGIHDLSRCKARKKGEISRLNMPFEVGVDMGCKVFGEGRLKSKKLLIMDAEKFRYHASISDLSSSDIVAHRDKPEEVVHHVRNWLSQEANLASPPASKIWADFLEYSYADQQELYGMGYTIDEIERMPISEFIDRIRRWLQINPFGVTV